MNYSCAPCNKTFNGIIPYAAHNYSEKHKKKERENANSLDVQESGPTSPLKDLDPYILQYGNTYKCIRCNITLNSLQQAQSHVIGKNHLKLLGKTPSRHTDMVTSVPSGYQSQELSYTFNFRNIKIENVTENIKIFDMDEPVCF